MVTKRGINLKRFCSFFLVAFTICFNILPVGAEPIESEDPVTEIVESSGSDEGNETVPDYSISSGVDSPDSGDVGDNPSLPSDDGNFDILDSVPDVGYMGGVTGEEIGTETGESSDLGELPSEETPSGEAGAEGSVLGAGGALVIQPVIQGPLETLEVGALTDIPTDATITDISVYSLSPVTPSDTDGLKAALLSVVGDYDPVIVEYQYQSSNGYSNYLREVQPDYVWLCSVALLGIVIYSLFRLGGALING